MSDTTAPVGTLDRRFSDPDEEPSGRQQVREVPAGAGTYRLTTARADGRPA